MEPAKIKALRLSAGFTQQDLAEVLGCGVATIQNWENGRAKPVRYGLGKLEQAAEFAGRAQAAYLAQYVKLKAKAELSKDKRREKRQATKPGSSKTPATSAPTISGMIDPSEAGDDGPAT